MPVIPGLLTVPFRFPETDDPVKLKQQLYRDFEEIAQYFNGAWTPYTPTTSNITMGNGTVTGAYRKLGRIVHAAAAWTFGSTSALTGRPSIGVPFTIYNPVNIGPHGHGSGRWLQHGNQEWPVVVRFPSDIGNNEVMFMWSDEAHTSNGVVNATHPFTPSAGDILQFAATYESTT
jgi:hypothetical protein